MRRSRHNCGGCPAEFLPSSSDLSPKSSVRFAVIGDWEWKQAEGEVAALVKPEPN
jgi:hypothetical protein